MTKFGNLLYKSCLSISVLMAIVMTLVVIANVIARYFFNFSLSWAEEMARYLMVWMVMLGSAMAVRIGSHFRMEMIEHRVGVKGRQIFSYITQLAFCFFGILLVWQGIILVRLTNYQYATATQIPMSFVYVSLPISGFIIIYFVAERLLKLNLR